MSIPKEKKADIIYTRLYQEYGSWSTWAEFAKEFGITRQQIYTRRKKGKIMNRELKLVFPEVNPEWLDADTYENLYEMPVKKPSEPKEEPNVDSRIQGIRQGISKIEQYADDPETLRKKQAVLLEFLADHVADLSETLQLFVESQNLD